MHSAENIFDGHRDYDAHRYCERQPQHILQARIHVDCRLIPQRDHARDHETETDGSAIVGHDAYQEKREKEAKHDP